MPMKVKAATRIGLILPALLLTVTQPATGQCANLKGFARQACEVRNVLSPSPQNAKNTAWLMPPSHPLTTSLGDTIHVGTLPPTVEPKTFQPLMDLDREDGGAFLLRRGFFEALVESYYFENYSDASARVGAFFPAPIHGDRAAIIASVLKQSELHPEIRQGDIEQLLQAVYAGTNLEKMPQPVQQTALILLPRELAAKLKGASQSRVVEQNVMNLLNDRFSRSLGMKPSDLQDTVSPILALKPEPVNIDAAPDSADLPAIRGTWVQMPGGFYVRYLPEGWARTRIQIMVPDAAIMQANAKQPLTFDPTQYLAVLAQPPAQRLGITLRLIDPAKR